MPWPTSRPTSAVAAPRRTPQFSAHGSEVSDRFPPEPSQTQKHQHRIQMSGSAESIREHTKRKFELLDAISMDPRVTAGEFRVAFRLMQHANAETGAIFPSQDRLASQIGMKERAVRACIAGLVSKGWLRTRRPNRRTSNLYSFDRKHINAILDRQISLNEARKEERKTRARPKPDRH